MSGTEFSGHTWPKTCTRDGCQRRPRNAMVEATAQDGGRIRIEVRALCNTHRLVYIEAIQADAADQAAAEKKQENADA